MPAYRAASATRGTVALRVAIISPYRLSIPGGVQNQVLGLARALTAHGDEVMVVAPGRPGEIDGRGLWRFVGAGRTLPVPANGSRHRGPDSPGDVADEPGAQEVSSGCGPCPRAVRAGPSLAATLLQGAPTVATYHRAGAGRIYKALGFALRPVASRIDRSVAVSPGAAETLLAVIGRSRELHVLGNAIDRERFAHPSYTKRDGRRPVICFVGRHEARKGLSVLILAVRLLHRDIEVRIVGDGPERARLESKYSGVPGLTWLGMLDDEGVAAELANADLFVAPSLRGESFGIVLLEAMAAGAAVIASDLPAYRLVAGDAAMYVPPGDPGALAMAIGVLLDDPHQRQAFVDAGRVRTEASTFTALAAAYHMHYEDIL